VILALVILLNAFDMRDLAGKRTRSPTLTSTLSIMM
jgi:hypothetical protein